MGARVTGAQCRDALFVHGDVIEIAKPLLQALEGFKELLAPFCRPLARIQAGKKFRRIAQLLALNTEPVTAACIQLAELFAFLANLAPASRQFLGREIPDREIALVADKLIILRGGPLSGGQPCPGIEG